METLLRARKPFQVLQGMRFYPVPFHDDPHVKNDFVYYMKELNPTCAVRPENVPHIIMKQLEDFTVILGVPFAEAIRILVLAGFDFKKSLEDFCKICFATDYDLLAPLDADQAFLSSPLDSQSEFQDFFIRRFYLVRYYSGADELSVLRALAQNRWNVERALVTRYTEAPSINNNYPLELDCLFSRYRDPDMSKIQLLGNSPFAKELGLDKWDERSGIVLIIAVSYHMNAAKYGSFSVTEFVRGMLDMRVTSVQELKEKLPELMAEMRDPAKFQIIYNFAFRWGLADGARILTIDQAKILWKLFLPNLPKLWPLEDEWYKFLKKEVLPDRVDSSTWEQLLNFVSTIHPNFSNWEIERQWPYLIEEFVESLTSVTFLLYQDTYSEFTAGEPTSYRVDIEAIRKRREVYLGKRKVM